MSKYGAKKVVIDNIKFASKIEGDYYLHLKQLQEKCKILSFIIQPKYELQSKFEKNGKKWHAINYIADFEVTHLDGTVDVIDIKGMVLEAFKIKQKLFEYKYPDYTIKLLTYTKKFGWETLEEATKRRKEAKSV
ncbi:hypothetical protein CN692_25515 [Bacillus sp. AFS002410]|uniref:DUF1064 domain-containing protein n=1 Tax=Bacillus sp. AFS002410 TaxID=2033481 RepID=UPI000BF0E923|nr:DUF1064 domain-containing protein [Bacillus sp. AFS002410]PEJ46945.1 hypothetical protein CN692_25515 [Bacillus sp. AFS002410]